MGTGTNCVEGEAEGAKEGGEGGGELHTITSAMAQDLGKEVMGRKGGHGAGTGSREVMEGKVFEGDVSCMEGD